MPAQRQPWETEGGPQVGQDVPITSEPREETSPGVPSEPSRNGHGLREGEAARTSNGRGTAERGQAERYEERVVEVRDPDLSPETNERLTEEVREVVGAERVRVPRDRAHPSQGDRPHTGGFAAELSTHRLFILRTFVVALTLGAIISLASGSWWLLPLAAGIHALGTMLVTSLVLRMTTITEHVSPALAAALDEQGVPSPDQHFSRIVDEFTQEDQQGAAETVSAGSNRRTRSAGEDPAGAAAEQSTAWTPTAEPSEPGGEGGAPDVVIWSTAAALFVLSIVLPAAGGGGRMWLLTAVMVPCLIGWVLVQRQIGSGKQLHGRGPLTVIVGCTVAAVVVFCVLVALAFQH